MIRKWPFYAFLMIVTAYIFYFSQRYTIGIPTEVSSCLTARILLIDTWDKDIREGDLVAFHMNRENHFYPKGLLWVKIAAAGPNSTVQVNESEIKVNENHPIQLDMTFLLNVALMNYPIGTVEDYSKTHILGDDEFFVIGNTYESYDSRFWGAINKSDIQGKAYAIF